MDPEKNPLQTQEDVLRAAGETPAAKNLHEDEPQVYNVMPRLLHKNSVSQPVMEVVDNSPNSIDGLQPASPVRGVNFIKILKLAILAVAVLGLGYAGYRFGPKYYKQYFLASKTAAPAPAQTADQSTQNTQDQVQATSSPDQNASNSALPSDWLKKYFGVTSCDKPTECGPDADPDLDGLTNLEEYQQGTDPNNPDSDGDGLSDGDEVHVFLSNPLKKYSNNDPKYTDADYFKGGYDLTTTQLMTPDRIREIKTRMSDKGLHPPTIATLGDALQKIYNFGSPLDTSAQQASSTPSSTPDQALDGFEVTPAAQQDRDAQRTTTIKNIGIGLVKYYDNNKSYPNTTDFKEMYDAIRVFMKVATNPQDPVNKVPYVYTYAPSAAGDDFTLAYYSEVVRQTIKKHAADAQKDKATEEAAIYDDQRINDLKRLQTALLLYSSKQAAGNQDNVFPSAEKYKTELLVSGDITDIPTDPKTHSDYEYKVNDTFNTFTLKAVLDNPPTGSTGYLCNQLNCDYY
ncbi:MAG: thrombospondin type 3 repeat-containing protein [Patescibacteria group bacterium]|nr:thrombospondin type 3 repeat-containing protein [Patescibacteria group bacterium]